MNLFDSEFQNSNIFIHLPRFDEIYYDGYLEGKVRKYRAIREELPWSNIGTECDSQR